MKKLHAGICCVGLLSLTTFAQEFDPKQRAKQSLALRAAAQDVVQLLSQQAQWDPDETTDFSAEMSQAILQDLKIYRKKSDGKTPAVAWLVAWRQRDFDTKMGEAIQSAQSQSPLPLDAKTIQSRAAADWQNQRDRGAEKFSAAAVDQVYLQARERAVSELKRQIEAGLQYPAQNEVDTMLLPLDSKRDGTTKPLSEQDFLSLKDALTQQVVPFENLLEEVDKDPARLTEKVLKDLWKQYQLQINLAAASLKRNQGEDDVWSADDIRKHMDEGLKAAPDAKPEARPPVYAVFEVVSRWSDDASADWEKAQLAGFLKHWKEGRVSDEMLETWIKQDLSDHLRLEDSTALLQKAVKELLTPVLVTSWLTKVPASRKETLQAYYLKALQGDGILASLWEAEIAKALGQQLPPIRQTLAQQQLKEVYPDLINEDALQESVVLWFYDRELVESREISQISKAFEWTEDPEPLLLSETKTLAIKQLNQNLIPALQSLAAQIQLIREMETDGMDELKAAVVQGQAAAVLYDQWLKAWQQRWQEVKEAQDPRWQEMMGRTQDELRKTVRQWYESVKDNPAEIEITPSQTPIAEQTAEIQAPNSPEMTAVEVPLEPVSESEAEEPNTDVGDSEGEEKPEAGIIQELENFRGKADGVLAFSDLGNGDCRLLFGAPDGKGALAVGFDPENVAESAQKIADALRGPLRDVLNGTASANENGGFRLFTRAKEPTLSMLFQVDSPKIRHQMSIQVRQLIQQEIDAWAEEKGQKAPALLWQDEMGMWQ